MHDMIVYHPGRSHRWFLPVTISAGIIFLLAAGSCLPMLDIRVLFFTGMGIVCTWLSKELYDTSNIALLFEENGLCIVGSSYKDYRFVPWEELSYAYYTRSFKGHSFLVLSQKALSFKEAKRLASRGANTSKIWIDYAAVIHMDILQDVSRLKEMVEDHIVHVDVVC